MKKEDLLQVSIIILGIIAIILNFLLFKDWRGIFYYTILSNIYVVAFYLVTLILKKKNKLKKGPSYYNYKGLMLLSILCTMLVYNLVIGRTNNIYTGHFITCYSVHLLIPVLTLTECLFFEDKSVLKYKYLLNWLAIYIMHFLIVIGYRRLGGVFLEGKLYPYDIMNFEELGLLKAGINCILVLLVFLFLGVIIVFIDNKMKKKVGENNG